MTLNNILKKISDVPDNRLEELYQFVNSLTSKSNNTESLRNKILSYGGIFEDMSEIDYADYTDQTIKIRAQLFNRNIEL